MPSTLLRVAILECGQAPPSSAKKYGGFGGMFTALLQTAASSLSDPSLTASPPSPSLSISTFNIVPTSSPYPSLDDIDCVLLTGSASDAFDDDEWILKLVSFVKEVLQQRRVRIVAACFGHQIMARALGARVGRSERGWEAGVVCMELTEIGKELFGRESLALYHSHRDEVYEYPPGVEGLAYTDICPNQGMYIPKRMMTMQGHPEFTEEIMTDVLEGKLAKGLFNKEMFDDAMKTVGRGQDGAVVGQSFLRFLLEE